MLSAVELREMIGAGESIALEFKSEQRQALNDRGLVEEVVCMANTAGGTLMIGVEDDGQVTGARARHEAGNIDPRRIEVLIANRTNPSVPVTASVVEVDGHQVLAIRVPRLGRTVATSDGRYLRRVVGGDGRPSCIPIQPHELLAREIDFGHEDFAARPLTGVQWDDLDPLEFDRLRRIIREGSRGDRALLDLPNLDIAKALGVVRQEGDEIEVRAGAVLLFGREETLRGYIPTHEVAFQVLHGSRVEVNDFMRTPLLRISEEALLRFRARNREDEVRIGLLRVAVPDYDEDAFREALANALVHRDYTRLGAVHVQWHPDELVISSPGGFPPGVRVDNILVVAPSPRSAILADAFKRAGLVERTGRGVDLIFEGQLRYGRVEPRYGRSSAESVIVEMPTGPFNEGLIRLVSERADERQTLGLTDLIVVNALHRERRLTAAEIASMLQRDQEDARGLLHRMIDTGLVEPRGEGKGRTYHLSSAVYRALGEPAGYVRTRGIEPLQQEQMVLQYIASHGKITRKQAADLCQLAPAQATRLLARLRDRGGIAQVGTRRGAHYVAVPKN